MIPDDIARTIIHGSPQGYDLGCRSKGGCANHGHPTLMTCVAAHAAAGSDWALGRRPRNEPIPKSARRLSRSPQQPAPTTEATTPAAAPAPSGKRPTPRTEIKHGTAHGFNRGCKRVEDCPSHGSGDPTCTEAHRRYYRDYRRRQRSARKITHGTTTGYSYGCHDRSKCPGDADGTTCPDAARAAERKRRQTSRRTAA